MYLARGSVRCFAQGSFGPSTPINCNDAGHDPEPPSSDAGLMAIGRGCLRFERVVSVCPDLAIDATVIIEQVLGHSRRQKTDSAASVRVPFSLQVMHKKRARGEKSVPCRARAPETLFTIPGVLLAGVYEFLNCGLASCTAFFLSCHATAEAFQLAVHNEARVTAACRVDRCRDGGLQEIKWFPLGYYLPVVSLHKFYDANFDVYAGQSRALVRYSRYGYGDISCRRLILNTSEGLDCWMRRCVVLESAECLNGTWRSLLASRWTPLEWGPTAVTIAGRKHGTCLARAGRRARGSRGVQRTEVALLFLKYDLFPQTDSDQRGFSFLDGDAVVHVDMHHDVAPEFVETLRARCAELRSCYLREGGSCLCLRRTAANSIASASPLLQRLRISSCRTKVQLTDAFGTQLGRWCPLLRHVDLSGLQVTDETLVAIARNCADLQSLRLSRTYVTDAGLKAIGEGCRGLRDFSLSGFTGAVTDFGLVSLSKSCFGLQKLRLDRLPGCSGQGLTAIAMACPQLMELDVSLGSVLITVPFAAFAQGCPLLRSVILTRVYDADDSYRTRLSPPRAHRPHILHHH
jgi:hypothetical protein